MGGIYGKDAQALQNYPNCGRFGYVVVSSVVRERSGEQY